MDGEHWNAAEEGDGIRYSSQVRRVWVLNAQQVLDA